MTSPTPESVYADLWQPIIENGQPGTPNFQTIKELLFDYGALLQDTSMFYAYVTEGQITDPQTSVEDVIQVADELAAETVDEGIRAVLNHLLQEFELSSAERPKDRLSHLINSINSIYELGAEPERVTT